MTCFTGNIIQKHNLSSEGLTDQFGVARLLTSSERCCSSGVLIQNEKGFAHSSPTAERVTRPDATHPAACTTPAIISPGLSTHLCTPPWCAASGHNSCWAAPSMCQRRLTATLRWCGRHKIHILHGSAAHRHMSMECSRKLGYSCSSRTAWLCVGCTIATDIFPAFIYTNAVVDTCLVCLVVTKSEEGACVISLSHAHERATHQKLRCPRLVA